MQSNSLMLGGKICATILCGSLAWAASADVLNMGPDLVSLETVPVGNPGNTGELSGSGAGGSGPDCMCGAVDYPYRIGKYEVTVGQYTEFLNAVAATDTYGLYNSGMEGIQRSGSSGNHTYTPAVGWANRPVDEVSWGDAARFANWLHNDQPTGDQDLATTENGTYHLNGATTNSELLAVTREANWKWAIPSEDEWYKAAYHKNDGATAHYFDYPTSSDWDPGTDLADSTGNNANYGFDTIGGLTEVGEFENSPSPYGTFDQGGNLAEWTEGLDLTGAPYGDARILRGGSWEDDFFSLQAAVRRSGFPAGGAQYTGFRVSQVPEPTSIALLFLGGGTLLAQRRRVRWWA